MVMVMMILMTMTSFVFFCYYILFFFMDITMHVQALGVLHAMQSFPQKKNTNMSRLTNKFHFPDSMGKEECIRGQQRHLGHHLAKDRLHAICSSQATSGSGTLHTDAVQLHNGSMLSVPHHGGLDHLSIQLSVNH